MAEAADSVVKTVKLTKIFHDFWLRDKVTAVAELDLDIRPREVFGLLGPNGSGKSTTLKIILGLLFPTRGQVAVFGRRATDVKVKSRIGFLPEESYLYPFLDAHETLDFYGRLFHQPRRERRRRIGMLLDMVGLSGVAYRRIGEYSKGMQRRIGLAQALINDPDLLILDEPTAGMDPIGTRQIKDLIRTLAERGKTVLLSSHLLADVEDVCDRVCILYGGRRRRQGEVGQLLAKQNLTQITTDTLDEATLGRIKELLASADKNIHSITTPREKLESLFLRIVEEAQSARVETDGAIAGGELADFLRPESQQGRELIEHLVGAADVAGDAPARSDEQYTPAPEVDTSLLEQLVSAAPDTGGQGEATDEPQEPAGEAKASGEPPPSASQRTDQNVIDDLLAGGQGHGKDS